MVRQICTVRVRAAFWRSRGVQSILLVIAIGATIMVWVRSIGGPGALVERYGILAPAISLCVHTALNTTPVGDLLPWGIANGAVYGLAQGAFLSWLAWLGSALLQYRIAKRTAHDFNLESKIGDLPKWLRRFPVEHPAFLITARWVPMGGALANAAAGAFDVKMSRLVWCTAIGALPPALVLAAVGAGVLQML